MTAGPLIGIEGIVIRTNGVSRVLITISAIKQSVSVEVPADYVEVIPTNEEKCILCQPIKN